MEWTQFIIFFLGVFGLFIWNRTESRADIRHMDNKLDAYRLETKALIDAMHETIKSIDKEMKDFHGRLCKIESERKG